MLGINELKFEMDIHINLAQITKTWFNFRKLASIL